MTAGRDPAERAPGWYENPGVEDWLWAWWDGSRWSRWRPEASATDPYAAQPPAASPAASRPIPTAPAAWGPRGEFVMKFCPSCGAKRLGRFCGQCGFAFPIDDQIEPPETSRKMEEIVEAEVPETSSTAGKSALSILPDGLVHGQTFRTGQNCENCGVPISSGNRCHECSES